jgi:S1-C subfamily serine protease
MKRFLSFGSLMLLVLVGVLAGGLLVVLQSGNTTVRAGPPSPVPSAGYLGITYMDVSMHMAAYLNLPGAQGALITAVAPGSPAEQVGLRPGDVIVSMDNQPVGENCPLLQTLLARRAGDQITVAIQRGEQYLTLPVVLSQRMP